MYTDEEIREALEILRSALCTLPQKEEQVCTLQIDPQGFLLLDGSDEDLISTENPDKLVLALTGCCFSDPE